MVSRQFIVVMFPEIQELQDLEGFNENSHLINDELGLEKYGSSSYFVNFEWLMSIQNNDRSKT